VTDGQAIARRYFELWNAGDLDGLMDLLSDDFTLHGMGMPISGVTHVVDKPSLNATARKRANQFAVPLKITVDDIAGDGDHVAVQCRSRAELVDGTPYNNRYSFHFHFRNGEIVRIEEYCCTYSVVKILRENGISMK
jgi:ketosteroid isomerase-like protein